MLLAVSAMTLHDVYLRPWKAFFAAGGRGAMLSHNSLNGIPMHMHHEVMTDIVRGAWGHPNVFFASDFRDIDAIVSFRMAQSLEDAAVASISAGMDQALGGSAFTKLADAVHNGRLNRSLLVRAAASTLREKFAAGLFDKAFDGISDGDWGNLHRCQAAAAGGALNSPANRALALRSAQEGTVLLKNGFPIADAPCTFTKDADCYGDELKTVDGVPSPEACCAECTATTGCAAAVYILTAPSEQKCLLKRACSNPLPTADRVRCLPGGSGLTLPMTSKMWAAVKTLAIVGPNANSSAAALGSYIHAENVTASTVLMAARAAVPAGTQIVSAALDSKQLIDQRTMGPAQQQLIASAVAAANASDLVVAVVGDSPNTCGEAADRISLGLPGVQQQLLKALIALQKPLILVLVHGRPVTFGPGNELLHGADAVLASWLGGEEQGAAIWSIINGEFNPSGRLNQPWPRSVGYVGTHVDSAFGPQGLFQGDYEGMGWRDGEPNGPLFPLGYGLSFGPADQYSFVHTTINATLSQKYVDIEVEVQTQPGNPGGAVVQLYFSQDLAMAVRPSKMLLAFAKVERSTAKTVTINVPLADLGYYHPLTGSVDVDPGKYTLWVGSNSADVHSTASLVLHPKPRAR